MSVGVRIVEIRSVQSYPSRLKRAATAAPVLLFAFGDEKIAAKFDERVAQIVRENSDDVSMPKAECQVEIMYRCKLLAKSAP